MAKSRAFRAVKFSPSNVAAATTPAKRNRKPLRIIRRLDWRSPIFGRFWRQRPEPFLPVVAPQFAFLFFRQKNAVRIIVFVVVVGGLHPHKPGVPGGEAFGLIEVADVEVFFAEKLVAVLEVEHFCCRSKSLKAL